ncbi:hypothetical protein CCR75_001974 [Bremia lactucae]|uniref:U-box domain-containing protein n=1 Tax=Bremia lactucae TaxID=4779 RepID=A0A976P018_BRELC|nr:hypothetical protein CCR75_001974 [Bremia lactucae]
MASCSASSRETSSTQGTTASTAQVSAGILSVDIIGARNLPPAVLGSLLKWTSSYANPYVVLSLDQERFVSTVKLHDLNPSWKETARLNVPLPTEADVFQSEELTRTLDKTYPLGKNKGGYTTRKHTGDALAAANAVLGYRQYCPCTPELNVQVFHRSDTPRDASSSLRDPLIGAVVVPLLSCLMSNVSSARGWYHLVNEDDENVGQLQLALTFDVSATSQFVEPRKGDLMRLTGFGGRHYYAKILPISARLEVLEVFQDQVLVETRSPEDWPLRFELHRNLLHIVHRPSLIHDASTQLQTHVMRLSELRVITGAHHLWHLVPETRRQQLENSMAFVAFFGAQAYAIVIQSIQEGWHAGVSSGVQTLKTSTKDAYSQLKHEFKRVYWCAPHQVLETEGYDDNVIDCGPRMHRGRIVSAFTADCVAVDDDLDESDLECYQDEDAVPEQLICPITGCPMLDPVVAADGHSYERDAIQKWLTNSAISPMTGMHMSTKQVFSNFTLRQLSEEVQATRRQHVTRRRSRKPSAEDYEGKETSDLSG